jgi:murein DD-endopeptidase MepM/ murein hydrolase activator NlpD
MGDPLKTTPSNHWHPSRHYVHRLSLLILLLFLFSPSRSRATSIAPTNCGRGVQLRISSLRAAQGSLLSATLSSAKPIGNFKATWDSRDLPFWVNRPWHQGRKEQYEALLGVDLEKAPGQYEVAIPGQLQDGLAFACKVLIKVVLGHFATERLQVSPQFVQPDEAQAKRAAAESETLRAIFDHVTPERLWTGPFQAPLDGVKTGGNFGKRRILNGIPRSPHGGVDFSSPPGTPIRSTQAGKVVLAQQLFFSGSTVVVDHGLGIYTFYGHLSTIEVQAGDEVKAGQLLGKVGATGRVTGPHLHWGLTVNRARVNALDILKIFGKSPS